MKAILHIARTEILEHRRQPWMLFILALNYTIWIVVFGTVFALLNRATGDPAALAILRQDLDSVGVALDAALQLATSTYGSVLFTNLPLFVAIMSGYSVLHDRACGTMPFLMLAPITRRQLLAGKLVGAMALPLLFHGLFVAVGCLAVGQMEVLAPFGDKMGGSAAWWIAYLLGGPASACFVGSLGTVISALSRDVRTSMQYTSFFIGLLSLGFGFALVDGIGWGYVPQLLFAAGCGVAAVVTLLFGARLLSRDVAPS